MIGANWPGDAPLLRISCTGGFNRPGPPAARRRGRCVRRGAGRLRRLRPHPCDHPVDAPGRPAGVPRRRAHRPADQAAVPPALRGAAVRMAGVPEPEVHLPAVRRDGVHRPVLDLVLVADADLGRGEHPGVAGHDLVDARRARLPERAGPARCDAAAGRAAVLDRAGAADAVPRPDRAGADGAGRVGHVPAGPAVVEGRGHRRRGGHQARAADLHPVPAADPAVPPGWRWRPEPSR